QPIFGDHYAGTVEQQTVVLELRDHHVVQHRQIGGCGSGALVLQSIPQGTPGRRDGVQGGENALGHRSDGPCHVVEHHIARVVGKVHDAASSMRSAINRRMSAAVRSSASV